MRYIYIDIYIYIPSDEFPLMLKEIYIYMYNNIPLNKGCAIYACCLFAYSVGQSMIN